MSLTLTSHQLLRIRHSSLLQLLEGLHNLFDVYLGPRGRRGTSPRSISAAVALFAAAGRAGGADCVGGGEGEFGVILSALLVSRSRSQGDILICYAAVARPALTVMHSELALVQYSR